MLNKYKNLNKCMNKKAQEQLISNIFYLLFVIFILIALIYFTTDVTKRDFFKKQIISKKTALLLDIAEPGTAINLAHEKFSVELQKSNILVKAESKAQAYEHGFFSPFIVNIASEKDKSSISIA